jgi:hypothetical protein
LARGAAPIDVDAVAHEGAAVAPSGGARRLEERSVARGRAEARDDGAAAGW